MATPGNHNTGSRATSGSRSRWQQRCLTGILLGMILVTVLGSLNPLLAKSPGSRQWMVYPLLARQVATDAVPTADSSAPPHWPRLSQAAMPMDIEDYWAADCLRELALRQQLPMEDNQFRPRAPVTWSTLAEMLNRSLPTEGAYPGASRIETALELSSPVNVLHPYPDTDYDPNRSVTRAEAVTAIAAKLGLPYVSRAHELLNRSLADGDRVPSYGREGVAAVLAAGVLVNYPDARQLAGNRLIQRGEIGALLCRASLESDLRSAIAPAFIARSADLPTPPQPDTELRGVWLTNIDSDVLFSQDNLAEGIQRLKAMNINTLYPVVWNFGYTQFPSATAERILGRKQRLWPGENPDFEATQGDRDMLQEIIDLAHAEGMAVIPWFEFGFMAPADYDLLTTHPDWFTERQDGSREIQQGAETFTWMNPFHPRTQQLLLLLMKDVLENYDVEGIQVDDHLGMPVDMGYDAFTQALYAREHNGTLPPEEYIDPEWMRWRAHKITEFMAQVKQLIAQRQPDAILSVSPNPYPFSYARYLQDWPAWSEADLVDELIIQVYRDDLDRFAWELNKPATVTANRRIPTSIGLLSGLRGRPTDVALLTEQLAAVRDRDYAGVSYFFYQSLWTPGRETMAERDAQLQASFAQPAARPLP